MAINIKLFLSWSLQVRELEITQRFLKDLNAIQGIELWKDDEQISPGDNFVEIIDKGIKESDYFIQLISQEQTKTKWANLEYGIAYAEQLRKQNLKIIKIIISERENIDSEMIAIGSLGTVIRLGMKNYKKGLLLVLQALNLDAEKSLVTFQLDEIFNDRTIIDISSEVNEKLIQYFSSNPNELKVINRRLFEELIAELFYGFGFQVELTKKTRDKGRDVIAIKNSEAKLKYLIECKRPDPGNVVGIRPVRELFGVKQDEKASKALLVTTTYFSPDALQFFERNKWELEPKDFKGILMWISDYMKIKNMKG